MSKYLVSRTKLKSSFKIVPLDERNFLLGCNNCRIITTFMLSESEVRKSLPLYCSNCGARMKTLNDGEVMFIV